MGLYGSYWVSLGLTESYLVLLGLSGTYWVSLGLNEPYWVLLDLSGFNGSV